MRLSPSLTGASPLSTLALNFNTSIHHIQIENGTSDEPVYVETASQALFYVRSGNLTRPLPVDEAVKYVQIHWGL